MGKANPVEQKFDEIIGRAIYDSQPGMPPAALKKYYRKQLLAVIYEAQYTFDGAEFLKQALKNSRGSDGKTQDND